MKEDILPQAKSDLLDIIKRRGEISVDDGATALDLARTTIRQHLATLEAKGFLKSRRHRHGRGRPRKMYRLTQKSEQFFDDRNSEFLVGFLKDLIENGHGELVDDYIDRMCTKIRREMRSDGFTFDEDGLEATQEFLRRRGFMPSVEKTDGENARIELHNCPFKDVVCSTLHICEVEQRNIEQMLGRSVTRTKHIGSGDLVCEYCVDGTPTND